MLTFRLKNGRRVELVSMHIHRTHSANPRGEFEKLAADFATSRYADEPIPMTFVWPSGNSQPWYMCVGQFTSDALSPEPLCHSVLQLCWFAFHIDRPLREIVEPGIADLDWEAHARDLSYW